jgi:hypothetical protein
MSEAKILYITPPPRPCALEVVDIENHPDRELLGLIAKAERLLDERRKVMYTEVRKSRMREKILKLNLDAHPIDDRIRAIRPVTKFGLHAKALYALGDHDPDEVPMHIWGGPLAVLLDALAMGVISS